MSFTKEYPYFEPGKGMGLPDLPTEDYWRQTQRRIKNKLFNSPANQRKEWKQFFGKGLDLSFLQNGMSDIQNEIETRRSYLDKFSIDNPFQKYAEMINDILPSARDPYPSKLRLYKDVGILRKLSKNQMGLGIQVGADNLLEEYDSLQLTGSKDKNETSIKFNYFSPNILPEANGSCNIQMKGRMREVNNKSECLFQLKGSIADKSQNCIFSINAKQFIEERGRNDHFNSIFTLSRKSMPITKFDLGQPWQMTSMSKDILGIDLTNRSGFMLSKYLKSSQRLYGFNYFHQYLNLNVLSRTQRQLIVELGGSIQNQLIEGMDFIPGYKEENKKFVLSFTNTGKVELLKYFKYVYPFVQLHSSLRFKTLALGEYYSFSKLVSDHCNLVLSAGANIDLGVAQISLTYNLLDLVPFALRKNQSAQFQTFQMFFTPF